MTKLLVKLFIKNTDNKNAPIQREKYGILSGIVGILMNILLFIGKFIAGTVASSISVIADAFNNLSDAFSSLITLVGFKMAAMPSDEEHPFGHGRIEYVSGLIVSAVILMMGFELGKSSIEKIITPEETEFSWLSFGILIAAILIKFWLFIFNRKLSKIIVSTSLKATSMDSLTDMIATLAVAVGLIISTLSGINIDGYMGIIVALFILYTGINTAHDSLDPLLGLKPDPELVKDIHDTVMSYSGVDGIHDLMLHNYGVGVSFISLHCEVSCNMNFLEAHELIDIIENNLKKKYNCIASIHMDPVAVDDEETNELREKIKEIVSDFDKNLSIHDFRITKGVNNINVIFDVVIPHRYKFNEESVTSILSEKIKESDSRLSAVICVDKQMA